MSRRTRIVLGILVGAIVTATVGVVVGVRTLEPRLRDWVTASLSTSLESEIELGTIHLDWLPLRLHARNLTARHHGRTDVPPLLVVSSFSVDLRPTDLWGSTVGWVRVDGLEVNIPPKDPQTGKRPLPPTGDDDDESDGFGIRRLTATNARLAIIPRSSGKNPRVWDIHELDFRNLRSSESAAFTASLINPVPYGKIESRGEFGPWQSADPGATPIGGQYTFAADLGTIEGLAGQLNAQGDMRGSLQEIATTGRTETPDFRLTELDGISLPLRVSYDAVVNGIKGDVELKQVDIQFGTSAMTARGLVEGTKGLQGKRVVVNLKSHGARLGELLQFVSKGRPPADGTLVIDAALDLPQGDQPVLDRVSLEGSVQAEQVRFSTLAVQDKIDELSRRGQGRPDDPSIDEVASRMAATFALSRGVVTYRRLSFRVAGADIRLDGTHSLKSRSVNLSGVVRLNATVSRTQTGFKSWLLKPFDPLFRKHGAGARLAITVAGTQNQPEVGLQWGRTLRGR